MGHCLWTKWMTVHMPAGFALLICLLEDRNNLLCLKMCSFHYSVYFFFLFPKGITGSGAGNWKRTKRLRKCRSLWIQRLLCGMHHNIFEGKSRHPCGHISSPFPNPLQLLKQSDRRVCRDHMWGTNHKFSCPSETYSASTFAPIH